MKRILTVGLAVAAVTVLVTVAAPNTTNSKKVAETVPPDPKFSITLQ